jgi:hypothetical protein
MMLRGINALSEREVTASAYFPVSLVNPVKEAVKRLPNVVQ